MYKLFSDHTNSEDEFDSKNRIKILLKYYKTNLHKKLSDRELIEMMKYDLRNLGKKTLDKLTKIEKDILVRYLSSKEYEILPILLEELSYPKIHKDEDINIGMDIDSSMRRYKSKIRKSKKKKKSKKYHIRKSKKKY